MEIDAKCPKCEENAVTWPGQLCEICSKDVVRGKNGARLGNKRIIFCQHCGIPFLSGRGLASHNKAAHGVVGEIEKKAKERKESNIREEAFRVLMKKAGWKSNQKKGWPDFLFTKDEIDILVEVKSEIDRIRDMQKFVLTRLARYIPTFVVIMSINGDLVEIRRVSGGVTIKEFKELIGSPVAQKIRRRANAEESKRIDDLLRKNREK